jgi:hypothetical protein
MTQDRVTDTIPRLHQLVPHMSDLLVRMSNEPRTFEDVRLRYGETVNRLAAAGLGRRTASRLSDADAYWGPTAELLQEAMRLGFLQRQPLPSSRRSLDSYRATEFKLTDRGHQAAGLAGSSPAEFTSWLAEAAISAHPYLRLFLLLLAEGPLVCPEIREGQIESSGREGRDTRYWANWAADLINRGSEVPAITAAAVRIEMEQTVTKRFGLSPNPRPTNKALSEAFNDAFAGASLRSRNLPMGPGNLRVLRAWGSQLLLFDESRYVPQYNPTNVVWLASDLVNQNGVVTGATRRGLGQYGPAVASALIDAYRRQAQARASDLIKMPYLPIHEVRAEAAFACRVTRALADLVLERLAAGEFSELNAQVWLHLTGGEVPNSEPIYRRGNTRRFSMTVTNEQKKEL